MFTVHPSLAADTVPLGRFELCLLLMMNDSNYPWFLLVPERENIREIHELAAADRWRLSDESARLAQGLTALFKPDKLNIAALGNHVPQLHLHHIVRYTYDPAWPAPVWNKLTARPYDRATRIKIEVAVVSTLADALRPL